jgi:hypothetical protein
MRVLGRAALLRPHESFHLLSVVLVGGTHGKMRAPAQFPFLNNKPLQKKCTHMQFLLRGRYFPAHF